jgi:hypothetical protein
MLKIHSIDGIHRNYQQQQLNSNLPTQALYGHSILRPRVAARTMFG